MITKRLRRRTIALGSALAAAMLPALVTPSAASADALRPLNVTLTCSITNGGNQTITGLPYGYQITTGGALYQPPSQSDASVSGNAKTFHLYMPTGATALGVNTWCNGFDPAVTWKGYISSVTPGTSTVNAAGYCNTAPYSYYPGVTYVETYCTLSSISYS